MGWRRYGKILDGEDTGRVGKIWDEEGMGRLG